jgi:hypothetical protein
MNDERYPRGKVRTDDLGTTELLVTVKDGTVLIVFSKPMDWIGLGYEEAKALGECLLARAEEIRQ